MQENYHLLVESITQGLPSMYKVNGRRYLVVSATTPVQFGRDRGEDTRGVDKSEAKTPAPQGGM